MKKINEEKGITLIALVITIIVLLILAGVSIAALSGQNGILTKAKEAKIKTENSSKEEQRALAQAEAAMNFEEFDYKDSKNKTVKIPEGCAVSKIEGENTVDGGLVIIDKNGNEWVWIEVPKTGDNAVNYLGAGATDNTKTTEIEAALKTYTNIYRNGTSYTDTWYSEEQAGIPSSNKYNELKNKMLSSIYDNEGFYIGRYEVGTDTARIAETDVLTTALIQKDKYPYNYVTCKQAQTLATGLTSGSKTSSLMFGVQWDLVLRYLENKGAIPSELNSDSTTWGNYNNAIFDVENTKASWYSPWTPITEKYTKQINTNKLLTTGATERNSKNNIYNLAGNVWEWNLEYTSDYSSPCAIRGGSYLYNGSYFPASYRNYYYTTGSNFNIGLRSTLF